MKVRLFVIGYGLLFILCLLWHVGTMEAQETMIRFYLIPARTDVPANVRCPEYFACGPFGTADPELTGAPYASKDYGLLPYFIVATDLTTRRDMAEEAAKEAHWDSKLRRYLPDNKFEKRGLVYAPKVDHRD